MEKLEQLKYLEGFKLLEVKQFEDKYKNRPDFTNKCYKLLFFILREGLLRTIKKITQLNKYKFRFLTLLVIEANNKKYLNISVQTQKDPESFVIKNEFFPYKEINYNEISDNLEYYLSNFNQFTGDINYRIFNIDTSNPIELKAKKVPLPAQFHNGLFIYGLGHYVKMYIIQHFSKFNKIACVDYKASLSESFKINYNFHYAYLIPEYSYNAIKNVKYPYAIIATYHSDHAVIAADIYKANPNSVIFIEKPPVVTLDDLKILLTLYKKGANIDIGFNRRHIKFNKYVEKIVKNKILIITCSVKEVVINDNHWYLWKNQGTRITGNLVHWIDLANFWIKSKPLEINLLYSKKNPGTQSLAVIYENGSILNITASDKGSELRGVQEKIEIRFDNETIFIDDYLKMVHIRKNGRCLTKRRIVRDKGHDRMYKNFINIIKNKNKSRYKAVDLINTSVVIYYAAKMFADNIKNLNVEKEIDKYYKMIQK